MSDAETALDERLRAVLAPGQEIVVGQAFAFPRALIEALGRHRDRLRGSRILFGMLGGPLPALPDVRLETFFPSGPLASEAGMEEHGACYRRESLYEIASALREGRQPVDVAIATATPAKDGKHSLGLGVDYIHPAAERASAVLLEIVEDLPWTGCGSLVAADDRTMSWRSGRAAPVAPASTGGDGELARRILRWIPDGATLELGIGKWSQPLLGLLGETRRHLRLHTGSLGDWVLPLVRSGALDGDQALKATAAGGSRAFYDAIPELRIELVPAYVTHDPATLRSLRRFRAINSVLEIDLLGRANSEFGDDGRRGGLGGLPDYAGAAAANPDGLSIVALPARSGARSRIVARLPDDHVSLDETMVDVVVTEHGSADLTGKPAGERARAMLAIAAPEFRAALEREALSRGLL